MLLKALSAGSVYGLEDVCLYLWSDRVPCFGMAFGRSAWPPLKGKGSTQASRVYSYGAIFISMFYFILMVTLGLILIELTAFIAARRASAGGARNL